MLERVAGTYLSLHLCVYAYAHVGPFSLDINKRCYDSACANVCGLFLPSPTPPPKPAHEPESLLAGY